jgi:hypothetical protein
VAWLVVLSDSLVRFWSLTSPQPHCYTSLIAKKSVMPSGQNFGQFTCNRNPAPIYSTVHLFYRVHVKKAKLGLVFIILNPVKNWPEYFSKRWQHWLSHFLRALWLMRVAVGIIHNTAWAICRLDSAVSWTSEVLSLGSRTSSLKKLGFLHTVQINTSYSKVQIPN